MRSRSSAAAARGGGAVILTVTLNAAIDRTVAVPNFRLGRRHRAVEAAHGRRAARASTSPARCSCSASR